MEQNGVRPRGNHSGVRGVLRRGGQRGGGRLHDRPSLSEQMFSGMLEDLPKGKPLETPKYPKKVRVLSATEARSLKSEALWSSLELIVPSTPPTPSGNESPEAPLSPSILDMEFKLSPAPYFEYDASSGASTPMSKRRVTPAGGSSGKRRSRLSPGKGGSSGKRRRRLSFECGESSGASTPKTKQRVSPGDGGSSGKKRRRLFPSSSGRPRDEITTSLNYGSEEESDEEEEEVDQPFVVSRVARMFMEEEDEDVTDSGINMTLEWPPQCPEPPICAPTLAWPASPTSVSQTTMKPSNKFEFEWRAFPVPQIDPQLRREPFSKINSGPTVRFTSPYDAFTAIWNREIIELIVRETNIYAQQLASTMLESGTIRPNSRITRWQDTTVNEVYTYLAIVLATGVVIKSRYEEYWNNSKDIFSTPGFSTEMSCDRFQLLSRCLHFNNNNDCDPALLTRSEAKLFKIKPILDHLNRKFAKLYSLSQNVALDESLTMWKGRLDINQFIRNKAATVGVKTYEVCESQTGYLWRFEVHAGHDTSTLQEDNPVSGIVPTLVLRLLKGLEHKGHTIWMDNFYNSPALARELKVLGFDCVGTLRTNRQFVPPELASITEKDMIVGQVVGCTSGDVDVMVWMDKKRVGFISTYHGVATTMCGDTLKPTIVQDYNVCMGGVDRKDQQLAMYPIERTRTNVWYKKLFRRLLNTSVLNSYILLQNQKLTHRKFRKALITDLLAAHRTQTPKPPTIKPTVVHSPAQYDLIKPGKSDRLKRKCAVCKRRTVTYCKACDVAMCIFTCYEPYHTKHRR